ncbi:MAG: Do family serine endopeptidase [Armatimonadota bacterium]|nr:Do family serine endopeptidase [Armatimonadota bacterium]
MDGSKYILSKPASLLVVIALSIALGASLAMNFSGQNTAYAVDQQTAKIAQRAALKQMQEGFISIADEILPSVVSITSIRTVSTRQTFPWFDDEFFKNLPFEIPKPEIPEKRRMESYGSGVIVRSDGYILTNDHVVGGAEKVKVHLKDGRQFEGKVTRDPQSDLAIIKIDAKNLPAARLGDSSKVKPGSWVIAVGSPFGLEQTITIGVVSAVGRQEIAGDGQESRFYPNLIQTDASINPGNSGGPLVNVDGEVIGINTLIRSPLGVGNVGIGFAIPSNTAKFVMERLIEHGKVVRGYLGIGPADLTPDDKKRYGVEEGALVTSVEAGTPADAAGIQVEDVIVEFDGKKITDEISLREIVASTPPGKRVKVVVVRNKQRIPLEVTVGERDEAIASSQEKAESELGFSVAAVTPSLVKKYNLSPDAKGVIVTSVSPDSGAARAGLQPGDLITKVGNKPIRTMADFNAAVKGVKSGDEIRMIVVTEKRSRLVIVPID